MTDRSDNTDEQAGYKNPPKHTQFKPGQSGNPNGRPRGDRNLKRLLKSMLEEMIEVTENGETVLMTKQEALIRRLFADAIKGNAQSARLLVQILTKFSGLFDR